MLFVPVLDQVAGRMAGGPVSVRTDAGRWAYHLRDAVALARPDWIVTHHDPWLEADALQVRADSGSGPADLSGIVDVALATSAPVAAHVELTRVLTGLLPGEVIAASITGPAGLCAAITGDDSGDTDGLDQDVRADCGDILADLVSAYVIAGASRILVWEPAGPEGLAGDLAGDLADAHTPIVRRLDMLGVPGVLCGAGVRHPGYCAHARAEAGGRALLVDPGCFEPAAPPVTFEELWGQWANQVASVPDEPSPALVISAGSVPRSCDMNLLRASGER